MKRRKAKKIALLMVAAFFSAVACLAISSRLAWNYLWPVPDLLVMESIRSDGNGGRVYSDVYVFCLTDNLRFQWEFRENGKAIYQLGKRVGYFISGSRYNRKLSSQRMEESHLARQLMRDQKMNIHSAYAEAEKRLSRRKK